MSRNAALRHPVCSFQGCTRSHLLIPPRRTMIHTIPIRIATPHLPAIAPARAGMQTASAPLDVLFAELLNAYRRSGGLARGSEVAMRAANRRLDGMAWLEDCLQRRMLISLDWHSGLWLPLFQFDRSDMSLREDVRGPCSELSGVMDGWELALWFVRPQCLLHHCSPLDVLDTQPELVLDAARREHFLQGA